MNQYTPTKSPDTQLFNKNIPIKINDLSFRDGHQSLFASRGRTQDMVRVAEQIDDIGFWACEVWGGATFNVMHQFLGEDPWERLRILKRYMKKTPLSTLLRGQHLVGNRNYADDVAKLFVQKSAENGLDIFRVFDPLNDYRNFEILVPAIKECGAHFQGCLCYSQTENALDGPVYNLDYYVAKARELAAMGADSICIKDMAGLLRPYDAEKLIRALKENLSVMIHLNSRFTSGMAPMTHLKAIEAGVDIVDTCLAPYAYRTSHPAVEPLVVALSGTSRDTGFDIRALDKINETLNQEVIPKYKHLLDDSQQLPIHTNVLTNQLPSAMLSNLMEQLKDMDALDKIQQVYEELPRVRKELGQIPLGTLTSQILGTQAINNVLFDTKEERYKMITAQVQDLCYGLYGRTPCPIDPDVQRKALEGYEKGSVHISCRPGQILKPELEEAKNKIGSLAANDEDLLTYILFPITGKKFLLQKYGKEPVPDSMKPITLEEVKRQDQLIKKAQAGELIEKTVPQKSPYARTFQVFVEGESFEVCVDEVGGAPMIHAPVRIPPPEAVLPPQPAREIPGPSTPAPSANSGISSGPAAAPSAPASSDAAPVTESGPGTQVKAPMPGTIIKYEKNIGDQVKAGETIVVIEAMKMENALPAPASGKITAIHFKNGDSVAKDNVLAVIQ